MLCTIISIKYWRTIVNTDSEKIQDLKKFDEAYFQGSPIIPDVQYDKLKKELHKKYPNNPYFLEVGAAPKGGKIDLPYPMGSLNQVYENEVQKWIEKYNLESERIVITEKLDGVSVLLIYNDGKFKHAYTRGDGRKGEDITHHIKNVPSVVQDVSSHDVDYLAVRAEVIMKNNTFVKYSRKYKNPRNTVAGTLNRKKSDTKLLKDVDVVAYEIIDSTGLDSDNKLDNLKSLKSMGFLVARRQIASGKNISDEMLSDTLKDFKSSGDYELDGVVVTVNDYSNFENVSKSSSLNPEHSVKFKVLDGYSVMEADVVDVHWKVSKTGFYKPRVEIRPIELMGSTITYATGFNAKYIHENRIGPGAKILLTKAGSVIPYIISVLKDSNPKMPDAEWDWDENKVEAVIKGSYEQTLMQVVHFFKTLGVENAQETSIKKVVEDQSLEGKSFSTIVYELICMFDIEWKRVLGENGIKVYDSLHKKLSTLKEETLLGATPFFGRGFGVRKSKKILEQMSFDEFKNATLSQIENIGGFDKTSADIYNGIKDFNNFFKSIEEVITFEEKDQVDNTLEGEKIVMTGFRDADLQEKIESRGGKVSSGVSKKTTMVIAADVGSTSGKVKKAKELGVPVMSQREFSFQYIK